MGLVKGAFVIFQTPAPVPTDLIVFQFNSETLTRRFTPQTGAQGTNPSAERGGGGPAHTPGPPTESYTLTIDLDAADQLDDGDPVATAVGVHPAIAQLELLLYPASSLLILNRALSLAGSSMVTPAELPLVLFVWGPVRVLPVNITALSVTEQQFDERLNPLQAKVELGLTVLTDSELQRRGEPFKTLATVMQVAKEGLARVGTAQSLGSISSMLPF